MECLNIFPAFLTSVTALAQDGFNQKDRGLLIELKVKVAEFDKCFEKIDRRFIQIDKRFDQMMDFIKIMTGLFGSLIIALIGFVCGTGVPC